ncbi:MAG: GIY-YIG nuclease family protein [Bacillota bacterium]
MAFVYIVECQDNTYYTGYTTDPERRLAEHNSGEGAKYTRGRAPVKLVYLEEYENKKEAMQREYQIKQLTRADKLELINSFK